MVKNGKLLLFMLILAIFPSACSAGKTAPTIDTAVTFTAAAMTNSAATAAAAFTQSWLSTISAAPQASQTPTWTGTPTPSATHRVIVNTPTYDNSAYISDVTIPDGTVFAPGKSFTKTWSFQNTGTCDWTTSFAIAFLSGDAMNGSKTALSATVNPGEKLDVSVALVAPMTGGKYTGYWRLQNAAGTFFGDPVYVQIVVSAGTVTITPTRTATVTGSSNTNTPTLSPVNTPTPTVESTSTTTSTETPTP